MKLKIAIAGAFVFMPLLIVPAHAWQVPDGQALPELPDTLQSKQFKVKSVQDGARLTLTVNRYLITGLSRKGIQFAIPVQDVVSVTHTTNVTGNKHMAQPWMEYFYGDERRRRNPAWSTRTTNEDLYAEFGVLLIGLILMAIDRASEHEEHIIGINWLEGDTPCNASFKVSKSKIKPVLAELQQFR